MFEEQFIRSRTPDGERRPELQALLKRVPVVIDLASRLNALPFTDKEAQRALLDEIFGRQAPETLTLYTPFFCDYGLNVEFGERVFVNQGCWFLGFGGITIGDRTMIGPNVTLSTSGHPVELAQRYAGITMRPIVIESDVWIGAGATIAPGVTIGYGSVVGAGTVVAKDVPPLSVVTGTSYVERKSLEPVAESAV